MPKIKKGLNYVKKEKRVLTGRSHLIAFFPIILFINYKEQYKVEKQGWKNVWMWDDIPGEADTSLELRGLFQD